MNLQLLAVTCSNKDHLLPTYPEHAKGEKNVVLNCTINNLISKAVALASPSKVDALFRLHDGQAIRVRNVYLGSNHQREHAHRADLSHCFSSSQL